MKTFGVILVGFTVMLCFAGLKHRTVYSTQLDPTGNYIASFSYWTYLSYISMPPGSSGDKPCFVKIRDSAGKNLGEIPVPMMNMADLEWSTSGAKILLVGEWDFSMKTCYYWSGKGDRKIYVRK